MFRSQSLGFVFKKEENNWFFAPSIEAAKVAGWLKWVGVEPDDLIEI